MGSILFEGGGKAHEKWDRIWTVKDLEINNVERNGMEYWLKAVKAECNLKGGIEHEGRVYSTSPETLKLY